MIIKEKTIDKAVLIGWLAFIYLGIINQTILKFSGGFGFIAFSWAFFMYFIVFFQNRNVKKENAFLYFLPFIVFAFAYCVEFQFVFTNAPVNESLISEILGFGVKKYVWDMALLFPFVGSAVVVLLKTDSEMRNVIKNSMLVILFIIALYASAAAIIDPNAIRDTAAGTSEAYVTYGAIYAVVVMFPAILFSVKKETGAKKGLFICLTLFLMFCILLVGYTIAITAMFCGVLLFLYSCIKKRNARLIVLLSSAVFLIVIFATGFYIDILQVISDIIPIDHVKEKIQNAILYFTTGETDGSGIRFEMYRDTFLMFIKHPFFGNIIYFPDAVDTFAAEAGKIAIYCGHSMILDTLSCCGILVFSALAFFLIKVLLFTLKGSERQYKFSLVNVHLIFLFVALTNTVFSTYEIFPALLLIAPCFLEKSQSIKLFSGIELENEKTAYDKQ